jgi:hypothetical protein
MTVVVAMVAMPFVGYPAWVPARRQCPQAQVGTILQ